MQRVRPKEDRGTKGRLEAQTDRLRFVHASTPGLTNPRDYAEPVLARRVAQFSTGVDKRACGRSPKAPTLTLPATSGAVVSGWRTCEDIPV